MLLSPYLSYIDSVLQPMNDPTYSGPTPPVSPPTPGLGSAGGSGVHVGAHPLRNKLKASSFPSAQEHPPTPPPLPPVTPPVLPPSDPPPADPPPSNIPPSDPPPTDQPPISDMTGGDGVPIIDRLELGLDNTLDIAVLS